MVLVTSTVTCIGWITGQYRSKDFIILILLLVTLTFITFLVLNLYERRQEDSKRNQRESSSQKGPGSIAGKVKRSEGSFALREKKAGLTWGGGNIKASGATRGTKREFLGK